MGRRGRSRPRLPAAAAGGVTTVFDMPLNAAVAGRVGIYHVSQPGRFPNSRPRMVAVRAARYDAAANTVRLTLGRFLPARPLTDS